MIPSIPASTSKAAELIAFGVLNPVMRSRSPEREPVVTLAAEAAFRDEMRRLFQGPASGGVELPTMETLLRDLKKLREQFDSREG